VLEGAANHSSTTPPLVILALTMSSIGVMDHGQDASVTAPAKPHALDESGLDIRLTAGVWLPRLSGDSSLGSGALASDIDFDDQLSLRDMEPTFLPEVDIRKGQRWRVHMSGFHFSVDDSTSFRGVSDFGDLELRPGDPVDSRWELDSVLVEVGYVFYAPSRDDPDADFSIAAVFGTRYDRVKQRIDLLTDDGGRESIDSTWLTPVGGLELDLAYEPGGRLPWLRRLELTANAAAGPALGEDGGIVAQVRATVTGHVDERFALHFGFRLVHLDVENDDYELSGGLQGLFVGGSIRF
jgi:hypothetical protein